MKKLNILFIALISISLFGCGSKTPAAATATPTATSQLSSSDPLQDSSINQVQAVDPALYSYLHQSSTDTASNIISTSDDSQQKYIGRSGQFSKSSKYGIAGTAQVISTTSISIKSFTYNGTCGSVSVGLTNQSNSTTVLAKIKEISQPLSASTFELAIPTNIKLAQFDSVGVYCPNVSDPVSIANLQ